MPDAHLIDAPSAPTRDEAHAIAVVDLQKGLELASAKGGTDRAPADWETPTELPPNATIGAAPLSSVSETPPGQGADTADTLGPGASSPDTAPDTDQSTAGQDSLPTTGQDVAPPDAPTAPDPLQLSDGFTGQPQSVTETTTIDGDGADTRPTDERMFSDMHVHQALNRESDKLEADGPRLQADTLTGLPSDASIVEGGYVYGTDSRGRVTQAYSAKLELEPGIRTRSELTSARGLGQSGDDAGHLIAARFGGSDSTWNLAPQDSNLNRGAWNQMERQWSSAVLDGHQVSINVMANYVGGDMRPASYSVQYWIDGKIQPTVSYLNRRGG